ncbi:GNAT family N-acetyltransferase [Methanosalsum natronophilum]|uniref:GNAT family N-acetyltransferase n=1 Tax=Methanosalsum natronophilum TaxID=768733 RepID=UPI00216787AD|nr:GNAT family N-acetyltransferase [Methanosalsum natronophilum]MCS3923512.1 amino-acid N-acetyltransferase [Methanosalsum natronophilum]
MNLNELNIRCCDESDRSSIVRLVSTYFLNIEDIPIEDFFLAESNSSVIGCIALIFNPFPEIHTIAIAPNHRGKGIGRQLINYVLEQTPKEHKYIYAKTYDNAFFSRVGFEEVDLNYKKVLWRKCASCCLFNKCTKKVFRYSLK